MSANPGALPGWFNRRSKATDQPAAAPDSAAPNSGAVNNHAPGQVAATGPTTAHTTTGGGKDDQTPVVVWEAANRMEAEIVAGRLQSEGIPALIRGEALGTIYGLTTGSLAAANVLVPALLAEKALAILTSSVEWDEAETGESAEFAEADTFEPPVPDHDANHGLDPNQARNG